METLISEEQFFKTYLKTNKLKKISSEQISELFEVNNQLNQYMVLLTNRLFYCVCKIIEIEKEKERIERKLPDLFGKEYDEANRKLEDIELGHEIGMIYRNLGTEARAILKVIGGYGYGKEILEKYTTDLEKFYQVHGLQINNVLHVDVIHSLRELLRGRLFGNRQDIRNEITVLRYAKFFFEQFFKTYAAKLPFKVSKKAFFNYIDQLMEYNNHQLGIDEDE